MMFIRTALVVAMLLSLLAAGAGAQPCVPAWSDEFPAGEIDGLVRCSVAADLDGEGGGPELLYIGGGFTRAGGLLSPRVVAFDGRLWHTLGAGLPDMNIIYAAAAFDDGSGMKVYVGGEFKRQDNSLGGRVYRWDGAGWEQVGADFSGKIRALCVFDDGTGPSMYAGGLFQDVGGSPEGELARWDGSAWQSVGGGVGGGYYYYPGVYALTVWDDGRGPALFVCGGFAQVGETSVLNLARWDGNVWEPLGAGVGTGNSVVLGARAWDDGSGESLCVTGGFQEAGGVPTNNTAKWDGHSWGPMGLGLGKANSLVNALEPFDDGNGPVLFAGGPFLPVPGYPERGGFAYWEGGQWWPDQISGLCCETGPRSLTAYRGDGPLALYVGGDFHGAYTPGDYLLRRRAGSLWDPLGNGMSGSGAEKEPASVNALIVWDDDHGAELHAGGQFQFAGGTVGPERFDNDNGAAIWDGQAWQRHSHEYTSFAPLNAFCLFDGGQGPQLYAGGGRIYGVLEYENVILTVWDGDNWHEVPGGPVYEYGRSVRAMVSYDDGGRNELIVGGDFRRIADGDAASIARFDGSFWSPLGAGLTGGANPTVNAMTTFDDGSGPILFAAGEFTTAGDDPAANIAAWDGTAWSALAEGLDGLARALCIFDDGNGPALYAGGAFAHAGGQAASNLARWDGQWSPVGAGTDGEVLALAVFDDGSGPALYIGGTFTQAGGQAAANLARFDGDAWSGQGLEADGPVRALLPAWESGRGVLWVGGSFLTAGGVSSGRIAKLQGCACYADFDGSGELDMSDFILFQSQFAAQGDRADCDASGSWDLFDFLCFVNAFNAGC